jgi:hypothetical protein
VNPLIKWIAGAGAARRRYALTGGWSAPGGACGNCACGNGACCGGTALCAFIPVEELGEVLGLVGVVPTTTRGSLGAL